jgi:hypothetical protein
MYVEYFAPAVRLTYEKLFDADIPHAQHALLSAVEFPDVTPEVETRVINQLSNLMSFEMGDRRSRHLVDSSAVWQKVRLCNVNVKGDNLHCARSEGATAISDSGKAFLSYFLKENFRWPLKSKLPTDMALDDAIDAYTRLFVKNVYLLGVEKDGKVVPLTFFVIHQRPNLALLTSEGRFYADDPWGEGPRMRASMYHPYFDLTYLIRRQGQPGTPTYGENLDQLNRLGIALARSVPTDPKLLEMPAPASAWTTDGIAKWLSWAPFKVTEYSAVVPSEDPKCSLAELNRRAEAITAAGRKLNEVQDLLNDCGKYFGFLPSSSIPICLVLLYFTFW